MSGGMSAGGAVVRQGHLRKLKTMKKKYFVLRAESGECAARLEYYESEKKWRCGAVPRRVLSLATCFNITRRLDLKQRHVIALFTRDEQLCVVAENEQELHAWLASLLKLQRADDPSEELLHPIQHVWQVNVQKKGLGAVKNIHGLYNLCLTEKTLSLVKIKSHNNVISELGIPERVEYALKNIRRCGDSECFFYMEVGRQTTTGAGELWMHSEDSNIAQSMHSTILHAMRNCSKELENERDHIVIPKSESGIQARRSTYSDGNRGRAGLAGDAGTLRNRCDSMPSRACSSYESERPPPRHNDHEGVESSRDETDAMAEWYRTPRIPEEPDVCDINKDMINMSIRGGSSYQNSRTSSFGVEDPDAESYLAMAPHETPDGYLPMAPHETPNGYLPMAPLETLGGLVSASSGSVCSGTPSTDPRFSEYQLEPATMHIGCETRPPRAYSVGSRPAPRTEARHRAYSVGARARPPPPAHAPPRAPASHDDLMLLDFTAHTKQSSPSATPTPASLSRTPPGMFARSIDEYVDMSPRNAGYVEMKPGELSSASVSVTPAPPTPVADGYVEMTYGKSRPIEIAAVRAPPPPPAAHSPEDRFRRTLESRASHGSQIFEFSGSLESPLSPVPPPGEEERWHQLATVREAAEDAPHSRERVNNTQHRESRGMDMPPSPAPLASCTERMVSCSPSYVTLKPGETDMTTPAAAPLNNLARPRTDADNKAGDWNSVTPVVLASGCGGGAARFSVVSGGGAGAGSGAPPSPSFSCAPLNYAALDLEPRPKHQAPTARTYTKIDFVLSEKLHAADAT